jgi:hypothetical protein
MTQENDYTTEMLQQIWSPDWFDGMFLSSAWRAGNAPMNPINPMWQMYHPYACNSCKRGDLTNNTKLHACQSCRVVKYCSREHQKADWPHHKKWCKAFKKVRESPNVSMDYANRQEWCNDRERIVSLLHVSMVSSGSSGIERHTTDAQIAMMQPRCRKCYKSGLGGRKFITCPRCGGVAICSECFGDDESKRTVQNHPLFHAETDDPTVECDSHLLAICCSGMIVEQGNPLGMPCMTDVEEYWNPKDWIEYFSIKKTNFELPHQMFSMAPIPAFLSDSLSPVFTVQHILGRLNDTTEARSTNKLVVHICGAAVSDEAMTGRYVEWIRLNPLLTELSLHFIGPNTTLTDSDAQNILAMETIRASCKVKFYSHRGFYHDIAPTLKKGEAPTVVLCTHAGMHDPFYTAMWKPTIQHILKNQPKVPLVLTGYTFDEVKQDAALLREWGAKIVIPEMVNPFRSLRPVLDPNREPEDVIYTNSAFVVAQGTA